jgi:hypothetical protein
MRTTTTTARPTSAQPTTQRRRFIRPLTSASVRFTACLTLVLGGGIAGIPAALAATDPTAVGGSTEANSEPIEITQDDSAENLERAGNFGVSPSTMSFKAVARGGSAVSDVVVVNNTTESATFVVRATGPLAAWTRFGPANQAVPEYQFDADPGTNSVRVAIDVPKEAANGSYDGAIQVIALPDETVGGNSGVSVTFEIGAALSVSGDQRLAATYSNLAVLASEVGEPVELRATVNNTGNVAVSVTAEVEILRNGLNVDTLDTATAPQTIDAGRSGDVVLNWETKDTLPGDYSVNFRLITDNLQLGSKSSSFRLEAPGKLQRSLLLDEVQVDTTTTPATLLGEPCCG